MQAITWPELERKILKILTEITEDNFDNVESLKNNIQDYFKNNEFSNNELEKAKMLIKKLSQEIDNKLDKYSEERYQLQDKISGFSKYLSTQNLKLEE